MLLKQYKLITQIGIKPTVIEKYHILETLGGYDTISKKKNKYSKVFHLMRMLSSVNTSGNKVSVAPRSVNDASKDSGRISGLKNCLRKSWPTEKGPRLDSGNKEPPKRRQSKYQSKKIGNKPCQESVNFDNKHERGRFVELVDKMESGWTATKEGEEHLVEIQLQREQIWPECRVVPKKRLSRRGEKRESRSTTKEESKCRKEAW